MTGEIDSIIMSLFSLKERLSQLEHKLEFYSSQQILVSLITSICAVVSLKLLEYLFKEETEEETDEVSDSESQFEESDTESDTDSFPDCEENLRSGCGSDSSGLEELFVKE